MGKQKKAAVEPPVEAPPAQAPIHPGSEKRGEKSEAVRKAIAAGYDKPKAGVAWIKQHLGIDVPLQTFSQTKLQDAKKAGQASGSGRPASKSVAPVGSASASAIELAKQVKLLVQLHGADAVMEMAGLFADSTQK